MKSIFISCFLLSGSFLFAQSEVVNFKYTYSTVSGGAEDSGTTATHSYHCVIKKKVSFPHLLYKNEPLNLQKGDTIIFKVQSFYPYNEAEEIPEGTLTLIPLDIVFKARVYEDRYYVNLQEQKNWKNAIKYSCKRGNFEIILKSEADKSWHDYAP